MTVLRYSAEALDLSRLPAPEAIKPLDYEALLSARRTRLVGLFQAAGIPYDVETLEIDPAMILQQEDAYRQLLDLAAINDSVRAVMVAFARGSDLDHLAAFYNLTRMVIYEGVMEDDERLRYRVLLAPEGWGLGKLAGYLQATLTAHGDIVAAGVWVDRSDPYQPVVRIAPQSRTGDGVPSARVLDTVRSFLQREDVRGATDVVVVHAPVLFRYALDVTVFHRPGPDPAVLRANATAALKALAAERNRPGRDVPLSAVYDAAHVPGVERVRINAPTASLSIEPGGLSLCTGVAVTTEKTFD